MRHGKERQKNHSFENCAPQQERCFQEGQVISTNAKPLNSRMVNDYKKADVRAGEKGYDSRTAFAVASTTDGRGRKGVEGQFDGVDEE